MTAKQIRRQRNFLIRLSYVMIDVLCGMLAIYLACQMRFKTVPFPVTFPNIFLDSSNPFQIVFLFWVIVSLFSNHVHRLYQTKREIFETVEIWEVVKAVVMSSILTIVLIYLAKVEGFPRSIFILTAFFTISFFSIWRIFKRFFVEYIVARGYNNFNTIIIGAGKVGVALQQEIEKKPSLGINIIGFLDDFKTQEDTPEDVKILGKLSDFIRLARKEFVDKVFISIHPDSKVFLQLLEDAKELGVAVRVIPQGFDLTSGEFHKYNIGFIPILEYREVEFLKIQGGKRLFDLVASLATIIVLSPLFIVLSIMIKMDSPGPIFYVSRRYGQRGQKFNMYKFRSMGKDAEKSLDELQEKNEVDGPIFKIKEDPRVTKFGQFLRKYSLDELPQFFNVLKGEMSLVGPRPFPIDQVEREDLKQLKRLEVRPGITGLWQIRGRSDLSFSRLVKWDIWYINNWSFWLDWNILLQTVPVVLKCKGAY